MGLFSVPLLGCLPFTLGRLHCVNGGDLLIFVSLGDLSVDRFCHFLGGTELGLLPLEVAHVVGLLGCLL